MLFRFSLYGFLKNQRYFEPFLVLAFLEQGLTFATIGWLVACRAVTVNLSEIPSGAMADTMGRRRVMMGSFIAYLISFVTFGLADSAIWFYPAMILFGIGDSFRTGTHKAMIFQWLRMQDRTDDRTQVYGYTRSWSKFGSAVSGILAAIFVLFTDSYRFVFLFAAIPCVLNLINFAGYPEELDGIQSSQSSRGWLDAWARARTALSRARTQASLRGLLIESMSWEGVFHAAKDYLQPILAVIAVASIGRWVQVDSWSSWSNTQQSALLIGPVYAILFFLSGIASRFAFRIPERAGSVATATHWLWIANTVLFAAIAVAGWFDWMTTLAIVFVLLHLLQNLWRPILISRFDDHASAEEGATMLSIESQAQRLTTMFVAPLLGWMIDWTAVENTSSSNAPGVEYWPIGIVGISACIVALLAPNKR